MNIVIPFDQVSFSKLESYQIKKLQDLHNPWALSQLGHHTDYSGDDINLDLPGYGFTGRIEFPQTVEFSFDKGYEAWYKNGLLHREDGPAVYYGHARYWYRCGYQHCATGPAFVSDSGLKDWALYGKRVTAEDVFQQLTPEQKEQAIWNLDEWR